MPHFDEHGNEEWVCQAGGHVCIGPSVWVEGIGNCCNTHLDLGRQMGQTALLTRQRKIKEAVAAGRAFVRGVNRREQITRQKILSISFKDDGQAFVCTTVSPYVVSLDKIEIR